MDKIALLFQGQGAQHLGMGKTLYENYSVVKEVFDEADSVLKRKISSICFHGSLSELSAPINMFPAILSLNVALYRLYLKMEHQKPDYVAGHSLGEYAALVCSGMLSFPMLCILFISELNIHRIYKTAECLLSTTCPIKKRMRCAKQFRPQTVGSSLLSELQQSSIGQRAYTGYNADRGASHPCRSQHISPFYSAHRFICRLMDKVSDMLLEQLNTVSFMEPSVSVLSNYTAQIYPSDAKQARQILALQTSNPCFMAADGSISPVS